VETVDEPVLRIQLTEPGSTEPIPLDQGDDILSGITWSLRQHLFDIPEMGTPLAAAFGDSIELLGYDLDTSQAHPGGEIALTLYWRALKTPDEAYTVFNHIVGPDGQFRGQFDSPPVGDAWLTNTWRGGEVIVDRRTVPIFPDAPQGPAKLVVGLYTADDIVRLPVTLNGALQPGDQLVLEEIEIGS
ncbi:MAG: hypothetical protein ACK2T3_15335, partial [Candidatus Promineifilaceae bacterium]